MTWASFYLFCFLAGLLLSLVSLLGGMGHFGGHVHVPHVPHVHVAHAHSAMPWWNGFSIMVFLCWFGAAGYLLTRHGNLVAALVLLIAALCGLIGGAIVFLFLTRVLMRHERELTAEETGVVGAVGRISWPIRAGGTGEMVYEQLGAVRSTPARSEDGAAIGRQEEVFVVRFEKGIAYVRRWEDGLGSGQ